MDCFMSKEEFEIRFTTLNSNIRNRLENTPTIGHMKSLFKINDTRFEDFQESTDLKLSEMDKTYEELVKEIE